MEAMVIVAYKKYQFLLEHFKDTKAMTRGNEAMVIVASMKYLFLLEHFKGTKAVTTGGMEAIAFVGSVKYQACFS